MNCVICGEGNVADGHTTVTLERGATTLVVKRVPTRVCANCGEEYVDETTAEELLKTADAAAKAGVQIDVREYVAA